MRMYSCNKRFILILSHLISKFMSLYKELDITKGRFSYEEPTTQPESPEIMHDIGAVVLRMGQFKYDFVAPAYTTLLPAERVLRLNTAEPEPKNYPGKPEYVAAFKAQDGDSALREFAEASIKLSERERVIAIGQDVQLCTYEGDPIYKPEYEDTREGIFTHMKDLLCKDGGTKFRVKSGTAVYGKNSQNEMKGVMLSSEMRFNVTQFTPEELELYIYGIGGKNGDNPDYLRAEVGSLAEQGLIDQDETDFIEGGTSIDRLKQTNGGFRWPHPVFLRHISEIDGISSDQEDFIQKQQALAQSLVGASPDALAVFPDMVKRLDKHTDAPTWQKLAILPDRELVQIRPIRIDDLTEVQEIAALVARNFREHPNYAGLTEEARNAYIESNNAEGVRGTAGHPDNILAAVVEGKDGIIAYQVVRKVNGNVAEGRRLHVHIDHVGRGIGSLLHEEKIVRARETRCTHLGSIASGASDSFVEDKGYTTVGRTQNKKLGERGVASHVNYALKEINTSTPD
jgi:hypothetical protein